MLKRVLVIEMVLLLLSRACPEVKAFSASHTSLPMGRLGLHKEL